MRVQILKDFVKQNFPATQLLDYALDVEKITTSKVTFTITDLLSEYHSPCCPIGLNHYLSVHLIFVLPFQKPNLILNVDGFIGVAFVDLLRTCGGFTRYVRP